MFASALGAGMDYRSNSLQLMKKLHLELGQMYLHFWLSNLELQIGQ
jgi:hypothetical protein